MSKEQRLQEASEILYQEGLTLDRQNWDDWLSLFTDDCELWIPSWITEHEQITDPQSEISLLYLNGKNYLKERTDRVLKGASPASVPMPRTCHSVSNILIEDFSTDSMQVQSVFRVDYYHHKKCYALFGHYQHQLVQRDGWKIHRKKITLMNDLISEVLDVYLI
ncbi:MAG: aromatic-ring-hydroxylating dioxygenase subunit beta [Gammaproteobacteria bacterium]